MSLLTGFPWQAKADARILILGSMPGIASLDAQQYYAHPRNAFWAIMGEVLGFDAGLPYPQRLAALMEKRVALWDVAYQCVRPGSLDSAMREVVANDFAGFFVSHLQVGTVLFNGATAEKLYTTRVLPFRPEGRNRPMQYLRMPSTSPAHASMRREEKLVVWQQALKSALADPIESAH